MALKSSLIAILIGIAHYILIAYCWGQSPSHSPLLSWVSNFDLSLIVGKLTFYTLEFIAHVLFSFPAAYVVYKLQSTKGFGYLILAILPSFLWINRYLITEPIAIIDLQPWDITLTNLVYGITAIPISLFIIYKITTSIKSGE